VSANPTDLDALLGRLRDAGLRVGVTEAVRLERVLALEPSLDVEGLRRIVTGVVAKSRAEVEEVARVLGRWRGEAEVWLDSRRRGRRLQEASPLRIARRPRERWWRRVRWRRVAAVALVAASLEVAAFWIGWPRQPRLGELRPWPGPVARSPEAETPAVHELKLPPRPETFRDREAVLRALPPDPPPERVAGLLGIALLLAGGLWWRNRGRSWLPPPEPVADRPGPSRVRLRAPAGEAPQLLAASEEEALVWGIERFVTEEPGDRLDVPATVSATARHAGRPVLEFERARHHREVWLWCDAAADDPFLPRLAAEVQGSLEAAGLVVERAEFWGVPHRMVAAGGAEMAPNELDERRDAAIVAVLTDARLLALELDNADRRRHCEALLRELGRWPRLAFVDFGEGRAAALLGPRHLRVVEPSEAFAFLGGIRFPPRIAELGGDLGAWAAALALPAQPVDEGTAHALRRKLDLRVSPWELRRLLSRDHGAGGRLSWTREERTRLLGWLLRSESLEDGRIADAGVFGRALDFWEERYAEEEEARRAEDEIVPWTGTPAEQRLRLERALVRLWRQPEDAAEELYRLFQAGHEETIRSALRDGAPADRVPPGGEGALLLPWRVGDLSLRVQVMLREMGLGERWRLGLPRHLRPPGRLWLALSLCAGVLAGGVLGLGIASGREPRFETVVAEGAEVHCTEELGPDAELWRCGFFSETPPLPADWPQRNLAIVEASTGVPEARLLAGRLLDSGSMKEVLLARDWRSHARDFVAPSADAVLVFGADGGSMPSLPAETMIRVASSEWRSLADRLEFADSRDLSAVWPDAEITGAGVRIAGRFRANEVDGAEIVFVPSGTYTLGADDLAPVHRVQLTGFLIGRIPVTNALYREYLDANPGRPKPNYWDDPQFNGDQQPLVGVDWNEARSYCQWAGMDLPTEAQWEAAARGTDQRRYPWGDEPPTRELADFDQDFTSGQPEPVGSHPSGSGPFGTLDQAGSVWEWCLDEWDPEAYRDRDGKADPLIPAKGESGVRVLRGGSWSGPAGYLAAAFRGRVGSSSRSRSVGFRCASPVPAEP
jgi:formylglycine-generating enzyme required for sulfatase activity